MAFVLDGRGVFREAKLMLRLWLQGILRKIMAKVSIQNFSEFRTTFFVKTGVKLLFS